MAEDHNAVEAQFEALRQQYVAQLPEKMLRAHELWATLSQASWDADACQNLHRLIHGLAGSGATFGAPTLSTTARTLEIYLKAMIESAIPPSMEQRLQVDALLRRVAQAAHDAAAVTPPPPAARPQEQTTAVEPPGGRAQPAAGMWLERREGAHRVAFFDDSAPIMRVLVVDDDPHILRLLALWLSNHGFQVETADSGETALVRLDSATPPDIMFLDVLMPGINGLQVLDLVRDQTHDMAIIMTTAFGSEQVAINALRRGADDYLSKPFDDTEFHAILRRTTDRLRLSRQNIALRAQLDEKHRQLEAELARAAQVQADLLPTHIPPLPGFELAARCIPTREVGGDFYDWQMATDNLLNLTMGDVMGKGMPAALLMTTVRATMRAVNRQTSPALNIRYTAAALEADLIRSESFVTLFHAQLDLARRELTYVDAGHGHVFVRRANGTVVELARCGLPLGILPDQVYADGTVELQPGDAFVLYSDGLTDLRPRSENHRQFLADLVADMRGAQQMVDRLLALPTLIGPASDDLTVVVLYCREELRHAS